MHLARRSQQDKGGLLNKAVDAAMASLNGILKDNDQVAPVSNARLEDLSAIGSQHPECQYIWGEIEALCVLGEICFEQGSREKAGLMLKKAIEQQKKVEHPLLSETEKLLKQCQ